MRTIYLDLDGVFFDFDKHYFDLFGVETKKEDDDVLWRNIKNHGRFFLELPLFDDAKLFLQSVKNLVNRVNMASDFRSHDLVFLSACGKSDFERTAMQKTVAVRNRLDTDLHLIFSPAGRQKYLFMRNQGDILIDDFHKNLLPWRAFGGFTILHQNDFDATFQSLYLSLVSNHAEKYDILSSENTEV